MDRSRYHINFFIVNPVPFILNSAILVFHVFDSDRFITLQRILYAASRYFRPTRPDLIAETFVTL